jgi:thiol-disulfide isomerase/thioredoxin
MNIGPFVLQNKHLLLVGSFALAAGIGHLVGRRNKIGIVNVLLDMALVGLLVGRVGFVLTHFAAYRAAPLSMLDIRDGGFATWAVIVGGLAMAAWRTWRRPALAAPLGAGLIAAIFAWDMSGAALVRSEAQGKVLPTMALTAIGGPPTTFAQLAKGRPMVVNLWASWCPPCRREMPLLADAQRAREDIAFVFVNEDRDASAGQPFLDEHKVRITQQVHDRSGQVSLAFGASAFPTTLFYKADGTLSAIHVGGLSAATLQDYLQALAAAPTQ